MPRPVSWLPRLHEMRRSVASSVRSYYDRRDLETLFQLQPRAAQKLLEIFPVVVIGTSRLVERDVLAGFLDRVHDSDDPAPVFKQLRQEKARPSRRKPRSLVRRDAAEASLHALPSGVSLTRGRVVIDFGTVEQLAEAMYFMARVLEAEGEEFAQQFAPEAERPLPEDADELRVLFSDLQRLEGERKLMQ